MGQLAMRAVHGTPALGDVEDHGHLLGQQRMHRMPARRLVDSGCRCRGAVPASGAPGSQRPATTSTPSGGRTRPRRRRRRSSGRLLDLGGDPRRHRPAQPQPDFPRTTASSIACALTASVNCADLRPGGLELPIPLLARTTRLARQSRQRGVLDGAPDPDHGRYIHRHLRAASAWLISPAVTCRKISHFVSADSFVGRRRALSTRA